MRQLAQTFSLCQLNSLMEMSCTWWVSSTLHCENSHHIECQIFRCKKVNWSWWGNFQGKGYRIWGRDLPFLLCSFLYFSSPFFSVFSTFAFLYFFLSFLCILDSFVIFTPPSIKLPLINATVIRVAEKWQKKDHEHGLPGCTVPSVDLGLRNKKENMLRWKKNNIVQLDNKTSWNLPVELSFKNSQKTHWNILPSSTPNGEFSTLNTSWRWDYGPWASLTSGPQMENNQLAVFQMTAQLAGRLIIKTWVIRTWGLRRVAHLRFPQAARSLEKITHLFFFSSLEILHKDFSALQLGKNTGIQFVWS